MRLHQTLADKGNPEYVEENGPFKCIHKTAWLGHGYYFWDTHIQLAHTWGRIVHAGNYMICSAVAQIDDACWDLHGTGEHREEFIEVCKKMISQRLSTWKKLLVPQVIMWLMKTEQFDYKAIRALGIDSFTTVLTDKNLTSRLKFRKGKPAYMDLYPAVQLCLYEKRALSLRNFLVVYPTDYVANGYA